MRELQSSHLSGKSLLGQEQIPEFHASECLARNLHSPFATWDDERVRRAFTRVRQLTIRFSVRGFCTGIHKQDYDEVLTEDMKSAIGDSYYTWALSSVIGHAYDFSRQQKAPITYVFDNAEAAIKKEVTDAMAYMESKDPGHFGNWMFGKRSEVPALQAVDLFAWTCFQQFRQSRFGKTIPDLADETDLGYEQGRLGTWRTVESLNREGIERWVSDNRNNPRTREIVAFKEWRRESQKPQPKKKGR